MKKLKVVAFVLLMAIMIINISSVPVFAADPIDDPGFWEPTVSDDDTLGEKIGGILGIIQVIGIIVSVIVLMILGIKYMLGSAEEKAINKKAMIPYLVGAVMVFSVTTIPNFIYQFSDDLFNGCVHEYTSQVTKSVGCTTEGVRTYTCKHCDAEFTEKISAIGHSYASSIVNKGIKYTCMNCGDSYIETNF